MVDRETLNLVRAGSTLFCQHLVFIVATTLASPHVHTVQQDLKIILSVAVVKARWSACY
jgi:hypothetical protein